MTDSDQIEDRWTNARPLRNSFPWKYFAAHSESNKAICIYERFTGQQFSGACHKTLSIAYSSNKSLISHLKSQHGVDKDSDNKPHKGEKSGSGILKFIKKVPFNDMKDYNTLISKLVCQDLLSIHCVVKSPTINYLFQKAFGRAVPSSPNTVRSIIMESYVEAKEIVKKQIAESHDTPSIMFDEWSSIGSKQFMNVVCYVKSGKFNCGLIEVTDDATAEHLLDLLKGRLDEFGVSNFKAITVDGARVNEKLSRLATVKIQKCMNHGVHLAVVDCIYKKNVIQNVFFKR